MHNEKNLVIVNASKRTPATNMERVREEHRDAWKWHFLQVREILVLTFESLFSTHELLNIAVVTLVALKYTEDGVLRLGYKESTKKISGIKIEQPF